MSFLIWFVFLVAWTMFGMYRLWNHYASTTKHFWVEFLIDLPAMLIILLAGSLIHTIRFIMGRK